MFSYDDYRQIIRLVQETGCAMGYEEALGKERFAIMRHDVEYSVERAFALAQVECEMGFSSTWFFQWTNNSYNILSRRNQEMIKKIREMGHHVGLHFALNGLTDMEEVRRHAGTAHVDDAILSFAQGYDTIVGERGVTLSGGQKQRVAIARTLMGDAPVLIFDDSLSAVDAETDAAIRASLHRAKGTATVILISHRITTLMQADHILVLHGGRIAQSGTHEELISRPGIYREIYESQTRKEEA